MYKIFINIIQIVYYTKLYANIFSKGVNMNFKEISKKYEQDSIVQSTAETNLDMLNIGK